MSLATATPPLARDAVWAVMPCHARPPTDRLVAEVASRVAALVIVDDGLPPARAAELDLIARAHRACVVRVDGPHGKGNAVLAGLHHARAAGVRAVLVIDSDGQHPPDAIPAFIRAAADADLVLGDRFAQLGRIPWERRVANLAACAAMRAVTGHRVRDTQCGMRLLRGRALLDVAPGPGGFEAETRHLRSCLRAGVPIRWVPIPAIYEGEVSAFRPFADCARIAGAMLV